MSLPRFIHLRVHTEYSLLEGAIPVKKLPGLIAGMDMPAVAVTDTNNLFCALEFSEGAAAAAVAATVATAVEWPRMCRLTVEYNYDDVDYSKKKKKTLKKKIKKWVESDVCFNWYFLFVFLKMCCSFFFIIIIKPWQLL